MSTWALIITLTFSIEGEITSNTFVSETLRPLPSEAACHRLAAARKYQHALFYHREGGVKVPISFNHACVEEHEA